MIKDLVLSFFDISKNIILAKRAKVLFYYPQHFNRSAVGSNPFFDPLIAICQKNGISYKLIEEPDWKTDKPRNSRAIKGDFLLVMIIALRKLFRRFSSEYDFYITESKIAKVINILTIGRLRYDHYITISGSLFHFLPSLKKNSKVYDLQHGILYKGHYVFFDQVNQQKLFPYYYAECLQWLFWGYGYRDCFIKNEENILAHRCHVVGYPISHSIKKLYDNSEKKNRTILVSMQFTADFDSSKLQIIKQMVASLLENLNGLGVKVFLKHHPRYNNVIDISDLYEAYPFVEETKESMEDLLSQIFLHVTLNSTTAFEFAEFGIPSFFMGSEEFPIKENLFYREYQYPLYRDLSIQKVAERLKDPSLFRQDAKIVREWYERFYTPLNEQVLLNLIR